MDLRLREGVGLAVIAPRGPLALIAVGSVLAVLVAGGPQPAAPVGGSADRPPALIEVPAGPFTMGAGTDRDPLAFENERWSPATGSGTVDLPAFYMAVTETTVGQFAAFVQATRHPVDARALEGAGDHPVRFVSWPDALAYCRWLEATLPTMPGVPAAIGDRLRAGWRISLPSEAQWEKAARGGDGRRFPWGPEARRDRANFESGAVAAVGQFPCPECPYSLRDMSGNVWEWTSSPYQPYPYTEADDRANLDADALWVMRGGHYGDPSRMVRTTVRGAAEPGARRAFIGFRVALVPAK
jgi:formylglycine-generating enzyme required for sulfatase activity